MSKNKKPPLPPGKTEANNKGKGGGHTKYNPELHETLVMHIDEGQRFYVACALVGVETDTVSAWIRRGKAGEAPFVQFAADVNKAYAIAEARCVQSITKAHHIGGDWKAAIEYLKRRKPKFWSEHTEQKVELSGKDGAPIETKNETRIGFTKEGAEFIRRNVLGISNGEDDPK